MIRCEVELKYWKTYSPGQVKTAAEGLPKMKDSDKSHTLSTVHKPQEEVAQSIHESTKKQSPGGDITSI